jgi:hypothetical protein
MIRDYLRHRDLHVTNRYLLATHAFAMDGSHYDQLLNILYRASPEIDEETVTPS